MSFKSFRLFFLLLDVIVIVSAVPLQVHPWPGGGTFESPYYSVSVDDQSSFVWYTSAANRQPLADGGGYNPSTSPDKDTSYTMFDMSSEQSPAGVLVTLKQWTAESVEIRPSSANIQPEITAAGDAFSFTVTEPRQVCAIVNGNADKPICIFADPAQEDPPTEASDNIIFFGPGVHNPGQIDVQEGQMVYLAGGAHVYGQVVGQPTQCNGVKVMGRGVLDGHYLEIDYRAHAMIDLPYCTDIFIEGITTVDSPQYQSNTFAPRGTIRFAKSIAWGFTTDGFGSGEYSLVEHCFFKVNDDSTKLFFTGMVVKHNVYWQMENGCPLMMSWNTEDDVGFVTAYDNAVIAHEKIAPADVDGVVCAYHGGRGNFNNYIIDKLLIEGQQWGFVSVNLLRNAWSPKTDPIGNISTIILRDVTIAEPFPAPADDAYHLWGRSESSRLDWFLFDNVKMGAGYLNYGDIVPGIGHFATNILTCIGCTASYFPSLADGHSEWSTDERCGRAPQPTIEGVPLPPLTDFVGDSPDCGATKAVSQSRLPANYADPKLKLLGWLHSSVYPRWHRAGLNHSAITTLFM